MKQFKNLKIGEVTDALIEMLEKLDIAGSTSTYNLYTAIQREHEKAKKDVYDSDKDTHEPSRKELDLAKQLTCKHEKLVENTYSRAIKQGADKFCPTCDCHFKLIVYPEKKLQRIFIKCDCGCGYDEEKE